MILWIKNEMAGNVEKLSDANKNILPEFQKFLRDMTNDPQSPLDVLYAAGMA
jgi:hypothetical protein